MSWFACIAHDLESPWQSELCVLPVSLRRFSPQPLNVQFFDRESAIHFTLSRGYCSKTRYSKFPEPKRRWSWSTIVCT